MTRYLVRRVASLVLTLLVSSVLVFGLLWIAPGDPATVLLGGKPATLEALAAIRGKYHLDDPLFVQYFTWLVRVLQGDFGDLIIGRSTVAAQLQPRVLTTVLLVGTAGFVMALLGLVLGIAAAVRRNRTFDKAVTVSTMAFTAIPAYVTGLLLAIVFGVMLNWLPTIGDGSDGGLPKRLLHLVLPATALVLSSVAMISRVTRASMIGQLESESILGGRIRGLKSRTIVFKYALRGALLPIVTVTGVQIGYLIAGAVLVETTFGLNGIGRLLVTSVQNRDFAVVQAITLILTAVFLVINLLVDLSYAAIDPRVRPSGGSER